MVCGVSVGRAGEEVQRGGGGGGVEGLVEVAEAGGCEFGLHAALKGGEIAGGEGG